MRASTYQRTAEFLIPPDDPKRPESFERTGSYFLKGLDTLGVRYDRIAVPYGAGSLRALHFPGPRGAETKPLIMFGGGFDSILEEYYPNFAEAALKRGYSVLTYMQPFSIGSWKSSPKSKGLITQRTSARRMNLRNLGGGWQS